MPLEIVEYYEDGFEFRRRRGELAAQAKSIGGTAWFSVGPTPSSAMASGRRVYIYDDGRLPKYSTNVTPFYESKWYRQNR